MKRATRVAAVVALAAAWAAGVSADGPAEDVSRSRIESALAQVRSALVNLTVVSRHFDGGRMVRFPSAGSGVIVGADGVLLTNYHVAGNSVRIQATLADGHVLDADVVADDPLTDLSVLRLRLDAVEKEHPGFTPAVFAKQAPQVGDPVLALGNPLTLASSVTLGIISNTRRVFTDFTGTQLEDMDLEGEPTGLFTQWIQHDALILPGNSGGPLVDLEGRIVGINELGGNGIGFAIPAAMAQQVLAAVLRDGEVRRADVGLSVLPVSKLGRETGALIASVVPGGPAAQADVKPGDILLAVDGAPVTVKFFEQVPELYRRLAALPIGGVVKLALERDGKSIERHVRTVELEKAHGAEAEIARLGITVQEVTSPMAIARHVAPRSGLIVTSLRPGFPAADAHPDVEEDDLLTAIDGQAVPTIGALRAALEKAKSGDHLLALRRDDEALLAVARLGEERSARLGGELPKAWLGVQTQVVTAELARTLGRPDLRGFRVAEVYPWSRAEKAGFEVGDVVQSLDGEALEAEREQDAENLRRAVEEKSIGDTVTIGLDRGGEKRTLDVVLEARPRSPSEARSVRQEELGFVVRELTLFDRVENHLDRDQQGVVVAEVVPGSWAQMAGLQAGDLMLSIGGAKVASLADFERLVAATIARRPKVVSIFVRRGVRTHFVFLEPDWAPDPAPGGKSR